MIVPALPLHLHRLLSPALWTIWAPSLPLFS